MAHSHIIKEEKRLSPLCKHVIDTHGYGIDSDGIMLVHRKCYLELGPDSVRTADKDRFFDIEGRKVEHSAERSDVSHHAEA